jgi:o-succinylbenzoate synthase
MMEARWFKYNFKFKFGAGTSRGTLTSKNSYFIILTDPDNKKGVGECGPLTGLSPDDRPDIEGQLTGLCHQLEVGQIPANTEELESFIEDRIPPEWPSVRMGFETAWRDLWNGGERIIFTNDFIMGEKIPINGLIWMGEPDFMLKQIDEKIRQGFRCIKLKIGAIDFQTEIEILKYIKESLKDRSFSIRVDANGAFSFEEAFQKLEQLSALGLHSIEQPIKPGQPGKMERLCRETGIPIALDEELIGHNCLEEKQQLLAAVKPAYIVLKPTLVGGLLKTREWIQVAEKLGIGWWITSALESNIGLNAIAQFTMENAITREQGLGTGQLFQNNIASPLYVKNGRLGYNGNIPWDLSCLGID